MAAARSRRSRSWFHTSSRLRSPRLPPLAGSPVDLPRELTVRYGITGTVANNVLFLKNLAVPAASLLRAVVLPAARQPID